jgi:hypothetical protein
MASTPETRYALSGGNHIAYQVADGAERDILYVPRTTAPIDLLWDDPAQRPTTAMKVVLKASSRHSRPSRVTSA